MSYCRWSTDDFQCDVYVYESEDDGFVTHVAQNRIAYNRAGLPQPVDLRRGFTDEQFAAWMERHLMVSAALDKGQRVPIGLPHDGATFVDDTAEECADRLTSLRELGYQVPQYAIDRLREETRTDS